MGSLDNKRGSAVFYESFYDSTKDLDDKTFREAWTALLEYAFYDEEPENISAISSMFFKMAKPNIDKAVQLRENGKGGGRPKKPLVSDEKPMVSSKKPMVIDEKPMVTNPKTKHIYDVDVDEDVDVDKDVDVDVDSESEAETDYNNTHIPTMAEIRAENERCGYGLSEDSLTAFVRYNREHGWKMPLPKALSKWNEHERGDPKQKRKTNKFQNFPINHDNDKYRDEIIARSLGGNL